MSVARPENAETFAAFLLRMRGIGLSDKALMSAIEATPRKSFVPGAHQAVAFSNRMIPTDCGQSIEGIDLQAIAISHLELDKEHRVLEIGTGSGFTSAVMARLCGRLTTVDRYKRLVEQARQRHEHLGLSNIVARQADGSDGLRAEGPFDRIVCWASFAEPPRHAVDWLTTNGVMVAPIGPDEGVQTLTKLTKIGSRFEALEIDQVRLHPLIEGVAAAL